MKIILGLLAVSGFLALTMGPWRRFFASESDEIQREEALEALNRKLWYGEGRGRRAEQKPAPAASGSGERGEGGC